MKIILKQDVKNLGKRGEVKDVSEGYARNFLLAKKLVEIATPESIRRIEAQKEKEKQEQFANLEKLRKIASGMKNKEFVMKSKEKGGKLFGSIGAKNIVGLLSSVNAGIDEKCILLENPIKEIGNYDIKIRLAKDIETVIRLKVEGE